MNAVMSSQGDDALALVEILDQVCIARDGWGAPFDLRAQAFETPKMAPDLRRRSVHILQRVCRSQTILPRSCILLEGITREGDTAAASGGFADVWKGCYKGNLVCIKAFRTGTAPGWSKIKLVRLQ